jgi:hypothetical protein
MARPRASPAAQASWRCLRFRWCPERCAFDPTAPRAPAPFASANCAKAGAQLATPHEYRQPSTKRTVQCARRRQRPCHGHITVPPLRLAGGHPARSAWLAVWLRAPKTMAMARTHCSRRDAAYASLLWHGPLCRPGEAVPTPTEVSRPTTMRTQPHLPWERARAREPQQRTS